jgi:hypothetical protein
MGETPSLHPSTAHTLADAKIAALDLMEYCRAEGWAGYDPYDGLSSRLTGASPFSRNWLFRLAVTQVMKRAVDLPRKDGHEVKSE